MNDSLNGYVSNYNEVNVEGNIINGTDAVFDSLIVNNVVALPFLGTGVLHSDAGGNITSNLIVDADVSSSAGIEYSKLALANSVQASDINSQTASGGYSLQANGSGGAAWAAIAATEVYASPGSGATNYLLFANAATGNVNVNTDTQLSYNQSTETLTVGNVIGALHITLYTPPVIWYVPLIGLSSGNSSLSSDGALQYNSGTQMLVANISGYANTAIYATTAGTATTSTELAVTSSTTNAIYPVPFCSATSGNSTFYGQSSNTFHFNPSTSVLTCPNITGTCSAATTATTATTATNSAITLETNNVNYYLNFTSTDSSTSTPICAASTLTYNPSTHVLTTPSLTVGSTPIIHDGNPIGSIIMYAASTAPTNYLLCNGASYSTTTYASLFGVIGYAYSPTSSGNFLVPDLQSRFPIGAGAGSGLTARTFPTNQSNSQGGAESTPLAITDLPAHNHLASTSLTNSINLVVNTGSALKNSVASGSAQGTGGITCTASTITYDTPAQSTSPAIIPPFTIISYIIKYQN